ncbi:hypothetical protein A4X13_0g6758 [Tilletia indica]|uniref:Cation-transporting P-type ATPase N-terminal domain-containing protein n=1 Tax=Tilletia indica TaxID=43049 RepID=A0A177T7L7_9BASI|nr:hypothetical protein A4X13_0g6758 [Tilletia indica]
MVTLVLRPRRRRRRLVAIKELSNAHSLPDDVNCAHFGIHSKGGLGPAEIEKRQRDFRPNHFNEPTRASALVNLARQVSDALTLVLITPASSALLSRTGSKVMSSVQPSSPMPALLSPRSARLNGPCLPFPAAALVYRGEQNNNITFASTELISGDLLKLSTGGIASVDLRSSASTVSGSKSPL